MYILDTYSDDLGRKTVLCVSFSYTTLLFCVYFLYTHTTQAYDPIEENRRHRRGVLDMDAARAGHLDNMIGISLPMQDVYRRILQVAEVDVAVMLLGESGTGKELAARSIHRRSPRADGPFIPVNTGAIAPQLV